MAIHYIPNDPEAGATAPVMRVQNQRPNRPANRSRIDFGPTPAAGTFAVGSPDFLFWQSREAALAALEAWEASAGAHKLWQGNRPILPLIQDQGPTVNAFYDRNAFLFFHFMTGSGSARFSGASTDVVAHEVGHGLLDSIRPDLWGVLGLEVAAFHEGFGDCLAILTALRDKETRQKLLAVSPTLGQNNFVETVMEELALGIAANFPGNNGSLPRQAHNNLQYQLPESLPDHGGPGVLIEEVHSFCRIFSGCFWDLVVNIFNAGAVKTEGKLATAAVTAGRILIEGARTATVAPRFLQSVGRAMVLADETHHGAANRESIRSAFQKHGILLGTNALISPSMSLSGPAPKGKKLAAATRRDLLERLGADSGTRFALNATKVLGMPMVEVGHTREVSLSKVDPKLQGVVGMAHDIVRVGESGARAAVMGAMPNTADSDSEVRAFARILVQQGRIDFGDGAGAGAAVPAVSAVAATDDASAATHAVRLIDGQKTLVRVRFQCGCGCSGSG